MRVLGLGLVAALVLFLIYQQNRTPGPELYNRYFKPYPAIAAALDTRERDETSYRKCFRHALKSYRKKQYAAATDSLLELTTQKPENDTLNLYIGLSYLARGEVEAAQSFLAKVLNKPESAWKSTARWYLALSHLQLGHIDTARRLLIPLKNQDNLHQEEARKVLQAID